MSDHIGREPQTFVITKGYRRFSTRGRALGMSAIPLGKRALPRYAQPSGVLLPKSLK